MKFAGYLNGKWVDELCGNDDAVVTRTWKVYGRDGHRSVDNRQAMLYNNV